MSEKQQNIIERIKTYKSIGSSSIKNYNVNSTNVNTTDPVEYLFCVLESMVGTEPMRLIIGDILNTFIDDSESTMKTSMINNSMPTQSDTLINSSIVTNGINLPLNKIDTDNKLKVDKTSSEGSILYGTDNTFDNKLYEIIQSNGNVVSGSSYTATYDKTTSSVNIKPNSGQTNGEFITSFINEFLLFSKTVIIANVISMVFGSLFSTNISENEIYSSLVSDEQLKNIISGKTDLSITIYRNSELLQKAKELKKNVMSNDIGCNINERTINTDDLETTINNIVDSDNSLDISNELSNLFDNSSQSLDTTKNKESEKDNFFKKIIEYLKLVMVKEVTTSPFAKTIVSINNSLSGNANDLDDYFVANSKFIKCLLKELLNELINFIYTIVLVYVTELVKPIVKKITKERVNNFNNTMKSLI